MWPSNKKPDISHWGVDQLVNFLARAEETGAVRYTKPLRSFPHSDCERDLFAHAALVLAQYTFEVLAESLTEGSSNIDLLVNNCFWEIKSPNGTRLRGVETAVRKAQKQFKKQSNSAYCPRLIFNARYHALSDETLFPELVRRLEQHGFLESLFITKAGTVVPVPINEKPDVPISRTAGSLNAV